MVLTASLIMMVAAWVAAAYVACAAISGGVELGRTMYHQYAGWSQIGDLTEAFEVFFVLAFLFWSFVQVVLSFFLASDVWKQLAQRKAEFELEAVGFETAMSWEIAIKNSTHLLLVAVIMIVSGFSMGDVGTEIITWHARYDDDTNRDQSDMTDGTSANQDVLLHFITGAYGMFFLGVMSLSSFIFSWNHLTVYEGGSKTQCDL